MRSAVAVAILSIAPAARADLRVHEWGVWKIRDGHIEHLGDLRREVPPFVRQAAPGGWAPGGNLSRKPVVFVYTDRPTDLDVHVRFTGGRPWLFFPGIANAPRGPVCGARVRWEADFPVRDRARAMPCEPLADLRWRVRATPSAALGSLPPVDRGHFWNHLRSVPATPLVASDGSRERFLFYDGPVEFPRAFVASRRDHGVVLERPGEAGSSQVVVAFGDRWVATDGFAPGSSLGIASVGWRAADPPRRGRRPLADEIARRLRAAGLSEAEARSLVDTWRPEIDAAGLRAFWLLPRAAYDALLPMEVAPTPDEVVRVGLVIEQLPDPR